MGEGSGTVLVGCCDVCFEACEDWSEDAAPDWSRGSGTYGPVSFGVGFACEMRRTVVCSCVGLLLVGVAWYVV